MTGADTPEGLHKLVEAVCPDVTVDGPLHRTAKTVLLNASVAGEPAVAKVLTDRTEFWHAKFTAEIATYRAFGVAAPPVPAPRLLAANPYAGVLVVTRLPGVPVSDDRYPGPLPAPTATALLHTADVLRSWRTPAGLFAPVFTYPDRFARYQRLGLLDAEDVAALSILSTVAGPQQMAHGDLLPANVLHQPADGPADAATVTGVLDWEFTGLFLPAFDLALLWVLLAATPDARGRIEATVGTDPGHRAGFWINVAMVATRELRTHTELPLGPLRETRLVGLADTWAYARARLHAVARQVQCT